MTHGSGISVSSELAAIFADARKDATVMYLKVAIVDSKSLSCTYTAKSPTGDKGVTHDFLGWFSNLI
jgi:hypothetical protein